MVRLDTRQRRENGRAETYDGAEHRVHRVRQDVFPLVKFVGGDKKQAQGGEQRRQDLHQEAEGEGERKHGVR